MLCKADCQTLVACTIKHKSGFLWIFFGYVVIASGFFYVAVIDLKQQNFNFKDGFYS